jgi:peptidyl-prolyl cis-trans isomerase C
MMKKIVVAALTLVSVGCFFGSPKILKTDTTVATVDGRPITVANIDSVVLQLQKNISPVPSDDSLKTAALDSLINHRLIDIRRDSIKADLNNDWDYCQGRLESANQTIMQVLFEKQIAPRVHVDSALVSKQYTENGDKYKDPEQIKAREILIQRPKPDTVGVTSAAKIKKRIEEADKFAKDRAEGVLKKALAGEVWDTLAAKYSEDKSSALKGGDLGYFYKGRMAPEFDSVAFAAENGKIVGPVATKFGYYIIKVEDHKPATLRPLDENLWNEIYAELVNEQQAKFSNAYLDSLKTKASFQYNEPKLSIPDSLLSNRDWIMVANGTDTLFGKTYKDNLPRYKRWKNLDSLTITDKKDMLNIISPTYLLRSAVTVQGYMQDPKITKTIDDVTNIEAGLRLSRFLRNLEYEPTEDDIANYFNAHADTYKETRPLQVHHILFQDSLAAEAVRDSIIAGADFAEMAKRYYPGDPEIREVLYNLDYIGPEEMGQTFYAAAEALKVGEVSHAVKTNWGYHLIKLVNRKQDRTLAQVRPGIKQHLKDMSDAQKTAALMAQWRKMATVVTNEDILAKYKPKGKKVIPIEATTPAAKGGK